MSTEIAFETDLAAAAGEMHDANVALAAGQMLIGLGQQVEVSADAFLANLGANAQVQLDGTSLDMGVGQALIDMGRHIQERARARLAALEPPPAALPLVLHSDDHFARWTQPRINAGWSQLKSMTPGEVVACVLRDAVLAMDAPDSTRDA